MTLRRDATYRVAPWPIATPPFSRNAAYGQKRPDRRLRAPRTATGNVAYFKIGPRQGYLITSPADVRQVLQDNARNSHKSPLYQKLRMSIGDGLLTSEDDSRLAYLLALTRVTFDVRRLQ